MSQFLEIDLDLGVLASSKGASIYFFTRVRADVFSSAKQIKDKNVSRFMCNEKCLKKNGIEVTGNWEFWTCCLSDLQHCKDLWKVMPFSFSVICYCWVAYGILMVFYVSFVKSWYVIQNSPSLTQGNTSQYLQLRPNWIQDLYKSGHLDFHILILCWNL